MSRPVLCRTLGQRDRGLWLWHCTRNAGAWGAVLCSPLCWGGVETSTPYLQRGVPGVWEYEERCPSEEAGLQSPGM